MRPASVMSGTRAQVLADRVRAFLLPKTIEHARLVSPYYARTLAKVNLRRAFGLQELQALPLLTKRDLTESYDLICRPQAFPELIMYTSGTEGRELLVPVSAEEIGAGERYFGAAGLNDAPTRPLMLSIVRVGHGGQLFSSSAPTIPAHITYGPEQVISLLGRTYALPGAAERISVLEGNLLTLKRLTAMLMERGVDGSSLGIELILTTGWYLTARQRRILEGFWSAEVLDRYGVTEVHGDAKQCPVCRQFHFDPIVVPEVVHPVTHEAIEAGIGSLVLTGLWPFNEVAPKIRYEIGDLVRIVPEPACGLADPAYEFLGRRSQALALEEGPGIRYLLLPTEVADVLDEYPEVVRRQHTGFLNFFAELARSGTGPPTVRVVVEWSGPQPGRRDEIAERLQARSVFLSTAIAEELCDLDIVFVEPHSLERIHKI